MIPKVIHYCWFGGKALPPEVKKCIRSWQKYCPGYTIRRWDETNFDVKSHPFVKAAYEAGAWAFVSDYARLQIVYANGGVYLDTDVELRKPLDGLLENRCYVGVEQVGRLINTGLGFGGEKGSIAVKKLLEQYDGVPFSREQKTELACPYFNTRAMEALGYTPGEEIQRLPEVTVYPPRFFDPLPPGDTENLLCADTVSIHHGSASWMSGKKRLKRRLIFFLGQERVAKLKKVLKK